MLPILTPISVEVFYIDELFEAGGINLSQNGAKVLNARYMRNGNSNLQFGRRVSRATLIVFNNYADDQRKDAPVRFPGLPGVDFEDEGIAYARQIGGVLANRLELPFDQVEYLYDPKPVSVYDRRIEVVLYPAQSQRSGN